MSLLSHAPSARLEVLVRRCRCVTALLMIAGGITLNIVVALLTALPCYCGAGCQDAFPLAVFTVALHDMINLCCHWRLRESTLQLAAAAIFRICHSCASI